MTTYRERIPFRLFNMECCGSLICHVSHRLPSYCSQCGKKVHPEVAGWAATIDMNATLTFKDGNK